MIALELCARPARKYASAEDRLVDAARLGESRR
jgi:hypothetical protein